MKRYFYQIQILLLILLAGCSRPTQKLEQAEKLMQAHPDSALDILKTIPASQLQRKADEALYALLYTQAQNKMGVSFSSDSLITIATNYYDESEPVRAGYAWFYKSRYSKEMENAEKLSFALCEAQRYADVTKNFHLKGLVYAEKGEFYRIQGRLDTALYYYRQSLQQFHKDNNLSNQLSDLCAMTDIFRKGNQYDSVFSMLKYMENLRLSPQYNLFLANMYLQCGSISSQLGNFSNAIYYFNKVPKSTYYYYNTDINQLICKVYLQEGKLDSASFYLQKVKSGKDSTAFYSSLQMELCKAKGEWKNALTASQRIVSINDSLYKKHLDASFAGLEKKYNYQSLKLKNQHLLLRNKRYTITVLGLILAFLGCFTLFLWWRYRTRKHIIDSQMSELEAKQKLFVQESENRALVELQLEKEKQLLEQQLINNQLIETQLRVQNVLFDKMQQYKKHVHKSKNAQNPSATPVNNPVFDQELIVYIDIEYNNFSHRLKNKYPELTEREVLICCLALAGFNTGMTAAVLNIQLDSANKSRHRIRKRIGVEIGLNFEEFLRNI